jgi:hypothetical protein
MLLSCNPYIISCYLIKPTDLYKLHLLEDDWPGLLILSGNFGNYRHIKSFLSFQCRICGDTNGCIPNHQWFDPPTDEISNLYYH